MKNADNYLKGLVRRGRELSVRRPQRLIVVLGK